MTNKKDIEDWYENHYSNGERFRLRETWGTLSHEKPCIKFAKDRAMEKINRTLAVVKNRRPNATFTIKEFDVGRRGSEERPEPGVYGWIDVFEVVDV
jgi:hypothetical protein